MTLTIPGELSDDVARQIRGEALKIPAEKVPEVVRAISGSVFSKVIFTMLLRSGVMEIQAQSPTEILLSALEQGGVLPAVIGGMRCLCSCLESTPDGPSTLPQHFPESVCREAMVHFQQAAPEDIEKVAAFGFDWPIILLMLRLRDGCLEHLVSCDGHSFKGVTRAEPLYSARYGYRHLAVETAPLFGSTQQQAEQLCEPLAQAENVFADPDVLKKGAELIEMSSLMKHTFLETESTEEALSVLRELAIESEEVHDTLYHLQSCLEGMATMIVDKINAIDVPAFSQADTGAETVSAADEQDVRTFVQFLCMLRISYEDFLVHLHANAGGIHRNTLALLESSFMSALLISYLSKRFPATFGDVPKRQNGRSQEDHFRTVFEQRVRKIGQIRAHLQEIADRARTAQDAQPDARVASAINAAAFHMTHLIASVTNYHNATCIGSRISPDVMENERRPMDLRPPVPIAKHCVAHYHGDTLQEVLMSRYYPLCAQVDYLNPIGLTSAFIHRFDAGPTLSSLCVVPLSHVARSSIAAQTTLHYLATRSDWHRRNLLDAAAGCELTPYFPDIGQRKGFLQGIGIIVDGQYTQAGISVSSPVQNGLECGQLPAETEEVVRALQLHSVPWDLGPDPVYFEWFHTEDEAAQEEDERADDIDRSIKAFLHDHGAVWELEKAQEILGWAGIRFEQERGTKHWKVTGIGNQSRTIPSAALSDGAMRVSLLWAYISEIGDVPAFYEQVPDKFKQ